MVSDARTGDAIVVCSETLPSSVRAAIAAACDRLKVRVLDWTPPSGALPSLHADPLLIIAGLSVGARSVPAAIGSFSARTMPDVPLCFFTEETLVRPSIAMHSGALHLVGAPLAELRVTAIVSAWIRARQRARHDTLDSRGSSMVGGKFRLVERAAGPHIVGSFVHETDAANLPTPLSTTHIGLGAAVALAQRTTVTEDTGLWTKRGEIIDLADSAVASAHVETRTLRLRLLRDDVDVRLSSPDRSPNTFSVRDMVSAGTAELRAESNDLLLLSWPRGAVSTELVGQIMLDGISPLLSAFELLFKTSPSAFAAAAIQVR